MNDKERQELYQRAGNILMDKYGNTCYNNMPEKYKYLYSIFKPESCGVKRKLQSEISDYQSKDY